MHRSAVAMFRKLDTTLAYLLAAAGLLVAAAGATGLQPRGTITGGLVMALIFGVLAVLSRHLDKWTEFRRSQGRRDER